METNGNTVTDQPKKTLTVTRKPRSKLSVESSTPTPPGLSFSSIDKSLPDPVINVGGRHIYTHGRPPWYDSEGHVQDPLVIGICGGSASGKTTVARDIIERLNVQWVSLICMDSYYKVLNAEERQLAAEGAYNFDHPDSFDVKLLCEHLKRLKKGKSIEVPEYDFKTHSRTSKSKTLYGANIIILEGIFSFYYPIISELLGLRVFVHTDTDERLGRRLKRDIVERGRKIPDVLEQYTRFVKPSYEQFIEPCMQQANIIIPRGGGNEVATQLVVQHINSWLEKLAVKSRHLLCKRDFAHELANKIHATNLNGNGHTKVSPCGDGPDASQSSSSSTSLLDVYTSTSDGRGGGGLQLPINVHVLPSTRQICGLHTIIRDRDTDQDAFVFFAQRLMRQLCEFAMSLLPYSDVVVQTVRGIPYNGRRLTPGTQVCGVSILRAGEAIESALSDVCKDVRLGKILIQTNPVTEEPELHYLRLPKEIKDTHVILMDSTLASGAAAIMAIRVLVEHDVPEEHIIFISLMTALQGIYSVAYTYPKVKIVTTAVDNQLSNKFHIIPGMGNFGDRYFGTSYDAQAPPSIAVQEAAATV